MESVTMEKDVVPRGGASDSKNPDPYYLFKKFKKDSKALY